MKLIVGLGNIGPEYLSSRHNAGFLCLSAWSEAHGVKFRHGKLYDFARFKDACLIMPNTFMNRSGLALSEALRRWKAAEALVVHDDIELSLAQLRLRQGGGDGGHNGMKSLLTVLPPDALKRIRVGIGRDESDPREYVLEDFTPTELEFLRPALVKAGEFIDIYIDSDFNSVLNAFSIWKKSCSGGEAAGNKSPKEKNNG